MPNTLSLQSFRINTGFLNQVDDGAPGTILTGITGGIAQSYAGMVGGKLVLDGNEALKMSYTTTGTLYGGIYQYVKFVSTATAAAVVGQACYWVDREAYTVTSDQSATNVAEFAGFFINVITKGNYGFIQIAGKATVKCKSTVTKTTPAKDDLGVLDGATSPTVDVLADATAITSGNAKLIVGVFLEAAASDGLKKMEIWSLRNAF